MQKKILVEVSARHIHLCQSDLEKLFGVGHKLGKIRSLSQETDFAAKETVEIETKKGKLNLRVVGPVRNDTQAELSATDAIWLGIKPVLKLSGEIRNTPGAVISGPNGKIKLKNGVIVAARHLHCSPKEAVILNLKNKQDVSIKIKGKRGLVFENIKVRVKERYKLTLHIDTDEGNAVGMNQKAFGFLLL